MNDPIVATMRQQRKQSQKIRRAKSKQEHLRKRNLERLMPKYRLDHVVRERYPTFGDVLRDLDDALCLVFLFAHHPAYKQLSPDVVDHCQRLALEWQAFVVRTGALQKTFVSIKGVYYQAVVHGNVITWLVPHQFTHDVAADVDYRVMFTFLELNRTVLSFALYKLYTDTGYVYPPKLSAELDELVDPLGDILAGSTVADEDIDPEIDALIDTVQRRIAEVDGDDGNNDDDDDNDDNDDDDDDDNAADEEAATATVKRSVKQLSSLDVHSIVDRESTAVVDEARDDADDVVGPAEFAPLAQDVETQAETHRLTRDDAAANLFRGKTFFLAREVSRAACEFALRALGARVSWPGGPLDESDPSITHQVVDRAREAGAAPPRLGRHYVQPQWIFDSINNGAQMPLAEYAPDAVLPPHLSPFVDDERVGYVPAFRQRLNALLERAHSHRAALEAAGKVAVAEALSLDQAAAELDAAASGNSAVSTAEAAAQYEAQNDPDVLEARHQRELEAETRGESFAQHSAAAVEEFREQLSQPAPVVSTKKKQPKRKFERVANALGIETEEEAMATMLTTNRKRRAINNVARRAARKSEHVGALQAKRSTLERKK